MTAETGQPAARIELMGAHEIRVRLGVGRRDAYRFTHHSSFPEPVAVLGHGKVWLRDDVEEWIRARRPDRHGRRPG
ncbi:helix-turn-helix transcriptional regulator [Pseudosporangium ferrugineum]|uniref:AlpA family transcriptional regulator n=1 Tax=Pseudosporangium ferrugineum TaxID=439699 RepID=A0A2T0RQG6_9ACTN|nr:AlpA family transcriptional regulator [Pseudosporangium ferrugineum]